MPAGHQRACALLPACRCHGELGRRCSKSMPVTLLRVFRRKVPRPVISRVVCRGLLIFSKLESRKSLPFWQRYPVRLASVRKPRASVAGHYASDGNLPDGSDHYEGLIPKWRQMSVFEGENVEKGEVVSEGPPSPHDILRLKGVEELGQVYR